MLGSRNDPVNEIHVMPSRLSLVEEPHSGHQAMTGSDSEGCKVRGGGSCLTSRAGNGASGLPGLKQAPRLRRDRAGGDQTS